MPDVAALDACEQGPPHHLEGNALRHTALVASALPKDAPKELIWAAIFHDVGKIATRTEMVDKNGNTKVQFLGHEKKSADILQERFARMREHKKTAWLPFSNTEQERILALVRDHIAILEAFPNMRPARAERFVDEHGELFPQLIALAEADTAGSYGDEATNTLHQETLRAIKDRYAMICAEKQRRAETSGTTDIAKLLDGRTIQDIFQEIYSVPLAPGPAVGFLKNAALEVALDKGLSDPGAIREALKEVIRTYPPDVLPKAPSKRR